MEWFFQQALKRDRFCAALHSTVSLHLQSPVKRNEPEVLTKKDTGISLYSDTNHRVLFQNETFMHIHRATCQLAMNVA